MVPAADFALVGPIAFLAILALNSLLVRRHGAALVNALLGTATGPSVAQGTPPGESNVVALRPARAISRSARPALRLAA
jgi:hypothetical protein